MSSETPEVDASPVVKLDYVIGDCIELMKELPDKSIDLVMTDPPYGIGKEGIINDDGLDTYLNALPDIVRVLKDNCFFATFCSIAKIGEVIARTPLKYRWTVILYYNNNMVRGSLGFAKYNPVLVFQKGDAKYTHPLRDVYEHTVVAKEVNSINHPTPKPVDFVAKMICGLSKECDTILDPFLGSGTTLLACRKTGRNCIGYEINPEYEPVIKERMMEAIPDLFTFDSPVSQGGELVK